MAHLPRKVVEDVASRQRPDFCRRIERIAHRQGSHPLRESTLEDVSDVIQHDEALRRDAGLAAVDDARPDGGLDRRIKIRARRHDERIAAAKLEHRLLQCLAGDAGDLAAGVLAACERDACHARILEHTLHLPRADQQRLKRALRKSCPADDVLDRQRTLRHVRRVLEQQDVAGHQRRSREPEYLPEGEVPWHDREDGPERLVMDEALGCGALRRLVGQELPGVLGVVAAAPRALDGFLAAGLQQFAHLERHQAAERLLLRFEDRRRAKHPLRAHR